MAFVSTSADESGSSNRCVTADDVRQLQEHVELMFSLHPPGAPGGASAAQVVRFHAMRAWADQVDGNTRGGSLAQQYEAVIAQLHRSAQEAAIANQGVRQGNAANSPEEVVVGRTSKDEAQDDEVSSSTATQSSLVDGYRSRQCSTSPLFLPVHAEPEGSEGSQTELASPVAGGGGGCSSRSTGDGDSEVSAGIPSTHPQPAACGDEDKDEEEEERRETLATSASTPGPTSSATTDVPTARSDGGLAASSPRGAPPVACVAKWFPSALALSTDTPLPPPRLDAKGLPVPHRHHVGLISRSVMRKPRGFEAKDKAMHEQGLYCKGCLKPLAPQFRAVRLGKSWDSAKFCYYTGYYYCGACHPCHEMSMIPARMLNYWDFTPLSVCAEAKQFLDMNADAPLLCVSAVNPKLFEFLPVLKLVRSLRVQLCILSEIGSHCADFQREFFGIRDPSTDTSNATSLEDYEARKAAFMTPGDRTRSSRAALATGSVRSEYDAHVIPPSKRYLVQDSEFWSMADLVQIRDAEDTVMQLDFEEMKRQKDQWSVGADGKLNLSTKSFQKPPSLASFSSPTSHPSSSPSAAESAFMGAGEGCGLHSKRLQDCELLQFLRETRTHMVRHVVQMCRRGSCTPIHPKDPPAVTVSGEEGTDCCFRRAARMCPLCKKRDFVYIFDTSRTRSCTKCGCCYHRECWQRRKAHHNACIMCIDAAASGKQLETMKASAVEASTTVSK